MAGALEPQAQVNSGSGWLILRDLVLAAVVVILIWLGLGILRSETMLSGLGPFVGKLVQALVALAVGAPGDTRSALAKWVQVRWLSRRRSGGWAWSP